LNNKFVEYEGLIFTEEELIEMNKIYLDIINIVINKFGKKVFNYKYNDSPLEIQKQNPYIDCEHKLDNLGKDVYINGSYWMIICNEQGVLTEGYHRIKSLENYCLKNNLEKKLLPCIWIPDNFEAFEVPYLVAKTFKQLKKYKFKTRTRLVKDYDSLIVCILQIPVLLRHLHWEYKIKYKMNFPSNKLVNEV